MSSGVQLRGDKEEGEGPDRGRRRKARSDTRKKSNTKATQHIFLIGPHAVIPRSTNVPFIRLCWGLLGRVALVRASKPTRQKL